MSRFTTVIQEATSQTFPDGSTKVSFNNGYEYKNKEGGTHREDGPAWEDSQTIRYYRNGRLHRVDGPAVIWKDSYPNKDQYFVNGRSFSKLEFYKHFGEE